MKICIVLGTRPEIIKMAPIIRACQRQHVEFFILHSGQHWDENMDKVFFEDLNLPQPAYNLMTGTKPFRQQVGIMIRDIQKILLKEKADVVLLQGDTHAVLCGALAGAKLGISVAHHEAGLRSHDLNMPEEKNRIIADHLSDFLFVPTKDARKNLIEEGIPEEKIFSTGNTVVDAVLEHLDIAKHKSTILQDLGLEQKKYFLVTAHRSENVDEKSRLSGILSGIALVCQDHPDTEIIFPIHPRTQLRISEFGLSIPKGVRVLEPVGYLDFLVLESKARLLITDSGGLQEEGSIMHVPCVTIRDNTERPETIEANINVLAGTNPESIREKVQFMLGAAHEWKPLFGDGTAGMKIVTVLTTLNHRRPHPDIVYK